MVIAGDARKTASQDTCMHDDREGLTQPQQYYAKIRLKEDTQGAQEEEENHA